MGQQKSIRPIDRRSLVWIPMTLQLSVTRNPREHDQQLEKMQLMASCVSEEAC